MTPPACVVIRPDYRGGGRCALPRLAAGVEALARLLADHGIAVAQPPVERVGHVLRAIEGAGGVGALVVYVGGHGLLKAGGHYTALDTTPAVPNSANALWARQVAELLADAGRDVVLLVDTCFAGAGATGLQQALQVLETTPTSAGFGVIAGCRAFDTAEDGVFVEALLTLLREGSSDPAAWTPQLDPPGRDHPAGRAGGRAARCRGAGQGDAGSWGQRAAGHPQPAL